MTDRHVDDLPVSEEDDEFLDENNRLRLKYWNFQKMIDFVSLRYDKNILRRLSNTVILDTEEGLPETTSSEFSNEIFSSVYEAEEDFVKQAVSRYAVGNDFSTGLDRPT